MYKFSMKAVTAAIVVFTLIQFRKSAGINLKDLQTINTKPSFKYRFDNIEFPPSGRDKLYDYGTVRTRKFNRTTYVMDGYVDVLLPLSDEQSLLVIVYTWQGNEYRKLGDRTISQLCSEMKNETVFMPNILRQTTWHTNFTCPIPAGRLFINNLTFPDLPNVYVTADRFRVNVTFLDQDENVLAAYALYIVKEM